MDATPTPTGVDAPQVAASDDPDYWFALINETEAAEFLQLTRRKMQLFRQQGDGPRYVVISSRCIRYRRIDLHHWNEARLRASTAEAAA